MSAFAAIIGKLAASLEAQFESIFSNSTNKGSSREQHVIDFLAKVCPGGIGFAKGEIFAMEGRSSGDVDVLIYDKLFSPVFSDGTSKILAPIEASYGTVEVKSKLTTDELRDCISKAARYPHLTRNQHPGGAIPILPGQYVRLGNGFEVQSVKQPELLAGVFAYENVVAFGTITAMLRGSALDYVVVPGKFIAIRNAQLDYFRINNAPPKNLLIETKDAVALWVLLIQMHVSKTRLSSAELKPLANSLIETAERVHIDEQG